MRRLLTGYAQQFNRRHIHLNPIRAGMVKDLKSLAKYDKSGHAVILGKYKYRWQDTGYVLCISN
jgi:hypothetical protein